MDICKPKSGFRIKIKELAQKELAQLLASDSLEEQQWSEILDDLRHDGHKIGRREPRSDGGHMGNAGPRKANFPLANSSDSKDVTVDYFVLGDYLEINGVRI